MKLNDTETIKLFKNREVLHGEIGVAIKAKDHDKRKQVQEKLNKIKNQLSETPTGQAHRSSGKEFEKLDVVLRETLLEDQNRISEDMVQVLLTKKTEGLKEIKEELLAKAHNYADEGNLASAAIIVKVLMDEQVVKPPSRGSDDVDSSMNTQYNESLKDLGNEKN